MMNEKGKKKSRVTTNLPSAKNYFLCVLKQREYIVTHAIVPFSSFHKVYPVPVGHADFCELTLQNITA